MKSSRLPSWRIFRIGRSVGDGAFRKKSGDKMKEILSGGVTGILVSHSIPQVRDMCNKILWLDHGKQILFTDRVNPCCDLYEEALKTKKMPAPEEALRLLEERCAQAEAAETDFLKKPD